MDLTSIGFAFSAGVIAFFSPCAFPMLPAYISYYLGVDNRKRNITSSEQKSYRLVTEGIVGGFVCALGAITVLTTIGLSVSMLGSTVRNAIKENIAIMEPTVGVILIVMGIVMLLGINLKFPLMIKTGPTGKGYRTFFMYGILYAMAAAGCTAPIFISVMIKAFVSTTFIHGLFVFFSYALGLGLLLVIVTVLVASAKNMVLIKLKRILPHVQKLGATILIIVGVWLVYYYANIVL